MKLLRAALIMFWLVLCWLANGYADRLYTWTDAKGPTHITQEPPPDTAKVVDTMDYSPQPNQPARRPAASERSNRQQSNPDWSGGQPGGSSDTTGFTSGDSGNDVEYDYTGGPYRQTLRRYERRGDWLDNNQPGRSGDRPVRVQPRPRMR